MSAFFDIKIQQCLFWTKHTIDTMRRSVSKKRKQVSTNKIVRFDDELTADLPVILLWANVALSLGIVIVSVSVRNIRKNESIHDENDPRAKYVCRVSFVVVHKAHEARLSQLQTKASVRTCGREIRY